MLSIVIKYHNALCADILIASRFGQLPFITLNAVRFSDDTPTTAMRHGPGEARRQRFLISMCA